MQTPDAVRGKIQTSGSPSLANRDLPAWQTHEALTLLVLGLLGWVVFPHLAGALMLLPWLIYSSGVLRVTASTR